MSVSCSCGGGDYAWYYIADNNYSQLPPFRRKRCFSCRDLINVGADTLRFYRHKEPEHDVEIRIYGEGGEIPLASWWLCERCAGLYFSIIELGYCITFDDEFDMRVLAKQCNQ